MRAPLFAVSLLAGCTGTLNDDGVLIAQKDSLITKCPSKFSDEAAADPEHVQISQ